MSGCLDLSAGSLFNKEDALDNTIGFSALDSTNQAGGRNTFANNLDLFKVTRSDYEDSDYFEESDEELLIDMEEILKSNSNKLKSSTFDMSSMEFKGPNTITTADTSRRSKLYRNNSLYSDISKRKESFGSGSNRLEFSEKQSSDGLSVRKESNMKEDHLQDLGSMNVEVPVNNGVFSPTGEERSKGEGFKILAQRVQEEKQRSDSQKPKRKRLESVDQSKMPSKFGSEKK